MKYNEDGINNNTYELLFREGKNGDGMFINP